jgi:hypothetical protein
MGHRFGWIAAVVVAGIAIAAGAIGYHVGVAHTLAIAAPPPGATGAVVPYMWYRPWGFGFGFGPLFFLLLFFLVLRPLVWGGFYGRRACYRHAGGIPPRFEEWHRRAHAQMNDQNGAPAAQPQHRA